jgi:hypothetical protein
MNEVITNIFICKELFPQKSFRLHCTNYTGSCLFLFNLSLTFVDSIFWSTKLCAKIYVDLKVVSDENEGG